MSKPSPKASGIPNPIILKDLSERNIPSPIKRKNSIIGQ